MNLSTPVSPVKEGEQQLTSPEKVVIGWHDVDSIRARQESSADVAPVETSVSVSSEEAVQTAVQGVETEQPAARSQEVVAVEQPETLNQEQSNEIIVTESAPLPVENEVPLSPEEPVSETIPGDNGSGEALSIGDIENKILATFESPEVDKCIDLDQQLAKRERERLSTEGA